MTTNPLSRRSGSDGGDATPRFAYGTQEFLDWHNSRRTRRDEYGDFALEWFYDLKGEMRLRYVKTSVRVAA